MLLGSAARRYPCFGRSSRRCVCLWFFVAFIALWVGGVFIHGARAGAAQSGTEAAIPRKSGRYTGLPLPRFASLRGGRVNMRRGPGRRYPIDWVLRRRYLPVEIVREFQDWRFVRIPDGTEGWVHRALLADRRSFVVGNSTTALRRAPRREARPVALLKPGVIGRLVSCEQQSAWCRAEVSGHAGYLKRSTFWGILPGEAVAE
jgi:SH3-like domain-containing protein